MEFTLHYRGERSPNATARDKHLIRLHFHSQLKDLWTRPPLSACTRLLDSPAEVGELSLIQAVRQFQFAPLVAEHVGLLADLDVLMLWHAAPGSIVTVGGDIDNRLKTLFDALKVPSRSQDLPTDVAPDAGQKPFFCLLEDDKLIARLTVETDRLLEPSRATAEALVIVRVRTRQFRQDLRLHPLTAGLA